MKVALLGATGFVGKNIGAVLTENNIHFAPASRKTGVDLRDVKKSIDFFEKEKPDIIINCAAHVGSLNYVSIQAGDVITDNCRMIISMYEAISKSCPNALVINPIANCAYPANAEIFVENNWWNGHLHRSVLSYGATKRLLWAVAECFEMQYAIRSIHLLVPNMYGPFDSSDPNKAHALNALISKFVKAAESGEKNIEVWGTGIAIREWLYAKDFGNIVLQIIKNPDLVGLSEPINIAQNFGLSVKELVNVIKPYFKDKVEVRWNAAMPDGMNKKVMDDTKFKKVFPNFKFTPLQDGIHNTIEYYKSIYPY